MAASGTLEQLQQYHRLLLAERRRRNPADVLNHEGALEKLLERLDEMDRRIRADPHFVEPSEAERRRGARELERWFEGRRVQNRDG
jgi:hypothetical protein